MHIHVEFFFCYNIEIMFQMWLGLPHAWPLQLGQVLPSQALRVYHSLAGSCPTHFSQEKGRELVLWMYVHFGSWAPGRPGV